MIHKIKPFLLVLQVNKNDLIYVRTPLEFISKIKKLQEDEAYRNQIISKGRWAGRRFYDLTQKPENVMAREIVKMMRPRNCGTIYKK